jgi:hypothetical protein
MKPLSLSWDTRKGLIQLKWDRFFSFEWKRGKVSKKIFGFPLPFNLSAGKAPFPPRWTYVKRALSLLKDLELKKIEGSLSFSDPMTNGILYGWLCALQWEGKDRRAEVTVNFRQENWLQGEVTLSSKKMFHHLKKWLLTLYRDPGRRG